MTDKTVEQKIIDKLEADGPEVDVDALLDSIKADINKRRLGGLRAVLASLIEKREVHETAIDQIDAEIAKMVADARRGIYPVKSGGGDQKQKGGDGQQQPQAKRAE